MDNDELSKFLTSEEVLMPCERRMEAMLQEHFDCDVRGMKRVGSELLKYAGCTMSLDSLYDTIRTIQQREDPSALSASQRIELTPLFLLFIKHEQAMQLWKLSNPNHRVGEDAVTAKLHMLLTAESTPSRNGLSEMFDVKKMGPIVCPVIEQFMRDGPAKRGVQELADVQKYNGTLANLVRFFHPYYNFVPALLEMLGAMLQSERGVDWNVWITLDALSLYYDLYELDEAGQSVSYALQCARMLGKWWEENTAYSREVRRTMFSILIRFGAGLEEKHTGDVDKLTHFLSQALVLFEDMPESKLSTEAQCPRVARLASTLFPRGENGTVKILRAPSVPLEIQIEYHPMAGRMTSILTNEGRCSWK